MSYCKKDAKSCAAIPHASYNSNMHLASGEILYKLYKFHSKLLNCHSFWTN